MKLSDHKDLKKEILALPSKEKDKLLLRLIARDKILTEHLHFSLLENEADLQERVLNIKNQILGVTDGLEEGGKGDAKEALLALRKLVKAVNHHFKVTKLPFEDVALRIFLFSETNTTFKYKLFSSYKDYEQIFTTYYLKAVQVTINKWRKLHEDLQFDLREELNLLLTKIHQGKQSSQAIALQLPKAV